MHVLTNGSSRSVWMETAFPAEYPPLSGDSETDVCVIGGGIAGVTTAYLLGREGMKVTLVDALAIGAGETGRTTAHFFPPDEWYTGLERNFGGDSTRLIASSFAAAIDKVESIARQENIQCEFERLDGYLYAPPGNDARGIDREYEAASRAGLPVEQLARVPGLRFDTGPCIRYPNQAQFHPLKYLDGLARAFVLNGGRIHCRTRAERIDGNDRTQIVHTSQGNIQAGNVVVATNTPFNNRVVMHTKQAAYRTYVIGVRVPRGQVPRILLWDTGDPYYYIRVESLSGDSAHDILIVGGADHKVGQDGHPQHRYDEIEHWVRERFPMALDVVYRWSGEVMEPADGPAYLGRNPMDDRNVYIVTGDSGNGMTHCTIGAMLVTDMIMGRENPWQAIYDPSRKATHALGEFVSEQTNTLAQYGDWFVAAEVESAQEIAMGEGAILRAGNRKLAVHRDEQGELHAVSAKCMHLGCVVHWNAAEQSWDCPCHGSRFAADGQVLHGPAMSSLKAVTLDINAAVSSATVRRTSLPARDEGR